jgi:hypothetical protein
MGLLSVAFCWSKMFEVKRCWNVDILNFLRTDYFVSGTGKWNHSVITGAAQLSVLVTPLLQLSSSVYPILLIMLWSCGL